MSGYDWHLKAWELGMMPFCAPPAAVSPRGLLCAQLAPPFPPDRWVTNLSPGAPFAWIAYPVVPQLYQAILLTTKPVMGPFPYGFPLL